MRPEDTAGWDGMDRRHADALGQFKAMLSDHTEDEMERYDKIIKDVEDVKSDVKALTDTIDENAEASLFRDEHTQRKIIALTQSVDAWMAGNGEFIVAMQKAFPKDEEGKPDYTGHKKAHLAWISSAEDEKEVMAYVRKQMKDEQKSEDIVTYTKKIIFAGAALAVVSFVAIATWAAFLKGPMP